MEEVFPEALITDYPDLVVDIKLPDPDDVHVVAAAISAECNTIITFNLRDFPNDVLSSFGITPVHPEQFIFDLYQQFPQLVFHALNTVWSRLREPPYTVDEYCNLLSKRGLERISEIFRQGMA